MSEDKYKYTFRHNNGSMITIETLGFARETETTIAGNDIEGGYFCVFVRSLDSFERTMIHK